MRYSSKKSGFSLVETLVAITILLIVIIGPMTISSSAAKSTSFASEQVTAFFLAQEGAELMEKARNDLLLEHFSGANSDPWADFTRTVNPGPYRQCYTTNGCNLSISATANGALSSPASCSGQDSCKVHLDQENGSLRSKFTPGTTGTPTIYSRNIRLQQVSANEVSVTSIVTWRSGFSRESQEVRVQTSLFNIYENN
jgi:prepilin-type N-terminal cleavage/methylation domain-containing protein